MATNKMIYLDANATCPVRPAVMDAMKDFFNQTQGFVGNPSSIHRTGQYAFHALRKARETIAFTVGAHPNDVVFTSGATEANNLFLQGFHQTNPKARFIIGAGDHDSVLKITNYLASLGVTIRKVNLLSNGLLDTNHLQSILALPDEADLPTCVSLLHANNETGVIQPLPELVALAKDYNAWVHLDAAQSLGKIPLNISLSKVDAISLSAHKMGGPQGVGALIIRDNVPFAPLLHGGRQEKGRRAGTENVMGVIGFAKAVELAREDHTTMQQIEEWRDWIEQQILAIVPKAYVFGQKSERLSTTSSIMMPNVNADTQLMAFDLNNIAVSAGAACSSGKVSASHVLQAMGISDQQARQTVRVSLGWHNSFDDCVQFVEAWKLLYQNTHPETKNIISHNAQSPLGYEATL